MTVDKNGSRLIRVLIVSSDHLTRAGLRAVIEMKSHLSVVDEVSVATSAVETAARKRPEVILVDLLLYGVDVGTLVSDLQEAAQDSSVLLLGHLGQPELIRNVPCSRTVGIVLNVQPPAVMIAAIESLCGAEPPQVSEYKPRPLRVVSLSLPCEKDHDADQARINTLTSREREVIRLIGKGMKNKDIADWLCISEITVRHHLSNIFSKLNVPNRLKLLILAHRHRLAELALDSDRLSETELVAVEALGRSRVG